MIQLDHKTKQFYLDSGFSESQISVACQQAQRLGMDIFDALNMNLEPTKNQPQIPIQPSQPQPNKNYNSGLEPKTFNYQNKLSFLIPSKKMKQNDYQVLYSRSNKHLQTTTKNELRQEKYPVGLLNVSNCCYLNSLLQCYFLMNDFKTAIMTAEPLPNLQETLNQDSKTKVKRIKSQYELLAKLKHFFTTMTLTSKKYLDPTTVLQNLVGSVGQKIQYGQEKDLSEINILIIQRLSEGLTFSKNHYQAPHQENLIDINLEKQGSTIIQPQHIDNDKAPYNSIFNPKQGAIKKMFYGTRVEYYDNPDLQKQPPIVSDFAGLIINPKSGNLYKALDEEFNFEVEINGGLQKKTAFIRDQAEYLFIYINRTDFDKEEGQALKNQHKFNFDFTVYLDRYLQKYRKEHTESHERIKELLASKNKLKQQKNFLQILFKKIDECQKYAQELEGWADKLPKEEEFEQQYLTLEQRLQQVEKQLDQIQSRKEQYHLMYVFVHRGDAVSGHYWGYGRNDDQWYRFDINTQRIMQEQIIIDLQKSAATPYALLYVKQSHMPKFDYKIYQDNSILSHKYPKTDFRAYLDPELVNEIISQNMALKHQIVKKNNQHLRDRTFNEYIARYNSIRKTGQQYSEELDKNRHLKPIQISNNFSLFLCGKKEFQLSKLTLFEQALYNASGNRYTVQRLMHDLDVLHLIQKKFKRSLKGDAFLKFYSLLPKELQKLESLYQEYQINAFEVIWSVIILNQAEHYQDQWTAQVAKNQEEVFEPSEAFRNRASKLLKLLRIRSGVFKQDPVKKALQLLPEPLYISQMNNEIVRLLLLTLVFAGLKVEGLQQYTDLSDQVGAQIISINAGNSVCVGKSGQEKVCPLDEATNLVSKFNLMMDKRNNPNKRQNPRSSSTIAEEKKNFNSSGFKNSILTSTPCKSGTLMKKAESKEEKVEYGLITSLSNVVVFQKSDTWKLEDLDFIKVNYDLGSKLLTFLKKLDPVSKIYKRILKQNKTLSPSELEKLLKREKSSP